MPPKFKPANKPSPGSIKHKPQTRKASPKVLRPKREPKKVSRSGNKRAPAKLAAEHEIHEVKVASDAQPARADKILSGLLSGISRSRVQKALDLGLITRDGEAIDRRTVLQPLDELTVALPAPEEPSATAVKMKLEVLFEDAHIIAINKPSGLLTHPVQGSDELSVVHGLLHHTKGKLAPAGGAPRPGVVHRLGPRNLGCDCFSKNG
jgi:23S rRNA-/tRNA-specific pseudouridylate synthase